MGIRDLEPDKVDEYIKELGNRLRSIREAQGFTVEEITDAIKIQSKYLYAIEAGELDKLPKGPYTRGFVRQYCEYLSAADIWQFYSQVLEKRTVKSPLPLDDEDRDYAPPQTVFRHASYWWVYLLIAIPIIAAAWITWCYRGEIRGLATSPMGGGTTAVTASADKSADAEAKPGAEPLSADEAADAEQPSAGTDEVDLSWMDGKPQKPKQAGGEAESKEAPKQAAVSERKLEIRATGRVWLRITQGNKKLYEGTLKAGDIKTFEKGANSEPIRVRYGNPQNAIATWKGVTANPVGGGSVPLNKYYE